MMATALNHDASDELWRECAAWLTRWEIVRPDHRANRPDAVIADLANILRDGVLLCKLLNKIDYGSIDMKSINLKPTMAQFLCLKNINIFLKTCQVSFGLKETDLFEPLMLFDLTNFHKVLCTLSKLSQSPQALRGNVPGFTAQKLKTREEEVIYQHLKSIEPSRNSRSIPLMPNEPTHEEIYHDLCLVMSNRHEQQPTMEKRDFVIKELVETENNYVDVLTKLINNFSLKLCSDMKPEDHEIVFYKIDELQRIHYEFNRELSKARYDPSIRLSSIFMRFREKFLVYGSYCANITKAGNLLQDLCDNDDNFNMRVEALEKKTNHGKFKLRDLLSIPMQRILKYHLLLDKLIENTDVNHEEYNDLRRAREAMLDVAAYINEEARANEDLDVLAKVQENITEWSHTQNINLSDYGRLIKDGEIKIKAHDDQKLRNRYVFIFDKCILICKQVKGGQFVFKGIINIIEYHVDEAHSRPVLNKEARWSYQFHLVKNDNGNVFTIYVRSIELKEKMIKAIYDALDNIRPHALKRTNHQFELQTFSKPTQCFHCSKFLKGLIYQGYKCNVCGIAVHKPCIASSGKCGAPPPIHSPSLSPKNSLINCEEAQLVNKLWFAGEMDRETAQKVLDRRENGTFLVRIRPRCSDGDKYALSLKTQEAVKHMKICCRTDTPEAKKYFLSISKYFSSIEELVLNYQTNSLRENFERLKENTKLEWPYRQIKAVAIRNFTPQDHKQVQLLEGMNVIIVGKEGYRESWWKGRTELNEIGFFPSSFVREEGEINFDV